MTLYASDSKVKRILCYGDSNTWGWVPSSMGSKRYNFANRWPGVLQKTLGDKFAVIEEGLGARTTMFDDPRPEFPMRNGLESLQPLMETHLPLDLVILMLGTTDAKEMMNLSVDKITEGMKKLITAVKDMKTLERSSKPKILVVVPPVLKETADFASKLFKGGTAKTKTLVESYKKLAEDENVFYLDPTSEVIVDEIEGVHIDNKNHEKLGKLIADKILKLLG